MLAMLRRCVCSSDVAVVCGIGDHTGQAAPPADRPSAKGERRRLISHRCSNWHRALLAISFSIAGLSITPAAAQLSGQLISADPVIDTPSGTQAWKVRYLTRDDRGVSRQVTGMVIAPREAVPARPRPVIAWARGTWGTTSRAAG